jgi:hypothetical protein
VRNHAHAILACDFFITVTARFRILYVFVVLDVGTRRIVHWNDRTSNGRLDDPSVPLIALGRRVLKTPVRRGGAPRPRGVPTHYRCRAAASWDPSRDISSAAAGRAPAPCSRPAGSFTTDASVSVRSSPLKRPFARQHLVQHTQPRAQMSARLSAGFPRVPVPSSYRRRCRARRRRRSSSLG